MPSLIPLATTASCTSAVMSFTESPPAVRSCVSCWYAFIARHCDSRKSNACWRTAPAVRSNVRGPVAQRLEQRTHNPSRPGSNPGGPKVSRLPRGFPLRQAGQVCQGCRVCSCGAHLGAHRGIGHATVRWERRRLGRMMLAGIPVDAPANANASTAGSAAGVRAVNGKSGSRDPLRRLRATTTRPVE